MLQVVAGPEEVEDPVRPVWGSQWTLPLAYEVMIGKKDDPFCFKTFPGADSVSFHRMGGSGTFRDDSYLRLASCVTASRPGPSITT